jgi:ABC-type branched-subunit amino acid transport system permease subunit
MSYEYESSLDPRPERKVDPRYLLGGYAAGLVAMSLAPLLHLWLFVPAAALVVAAVAVLVATVRPRFDDVARGAYFAAVFGVVAMLVLSFVSAQG